MTPSLKNQTSFDNKSPLAPNNMQPILNTNIPIFEQKRNTPNFNQISFEKESGNMSARNMYDASKKMLRDMVQTDRSPRSGQSSKNSMRPGNEMLRQKQMSRGNDVDIRAPRNTMMQKQPMLGGLMKNDKNHETYLYESNNTYNNYQNSSSQGNMDIAKDLKNLDMGERPNRETDLMEMDFDYDPDAKSEYTEQTSKQSKSRKSDSFSEDEEEQEEDTDSVKEIDYEEASEHKSEEEQSQKKKPTSDNKAVSEMPRPTNFRAPNFKLPAKSDGNATIGQRSFGTSSK
jgi:hypothetical protein